MKNTRKLQLSALLTAGAIAFAGLSLADSLPWRPLAGTGGSAPNITINEVYGGGGNAGAHFRHDFVELYNPGDSAVHLDGLRLEYWSASGGPGGTVNLNGHMGPREFFVVRGAAGQGGAADVVAQAEIPASFSASNAVVRLVRADDQLVVDQVGTGDAIPERREGAAAPAMNNVQSVGRHPDGRDTDDNAADFALGSPTPGGANFAPLPEEQVPAAPAPSGTPSPFATLAEIQGTGERSGYVGKRVATRGWVTASFPTHGLHGYYLQEGEGTLRAPGEPSQAIYVYASAQGTVPPVGACVAVEGEVSEYGASQKNGPGTLTQVAAPHYALLPAPECGPQPAPIAAPLPDGDAAREANEGMLFQPPGPHVVTDNYSLNTYGSFGAVAGTEPLWQATDVVEPGSAAVAFEAANRAREFVIDDGSNGNFEQGARERIPPYLGAAGTSFPLRTGDRFTITSPMVLSYQHGNWTLLPQAPVTGETPQAALPIAWQGSRSAEAAGPAPVGGSLSLSSFNVLNYFTTVGQLLPDCRPHGRYPSQTRDCDARGAFTPEALRDQEAKLVAAINGLDATVLGIEEIENSARFGAPRDAALSRLVDALNAAAGFEKWAYVPSPSRVPAHADVVRVALIYQRGQVLPVGESRILDDAAFNGIARQPLAHRFSTPAGADFIVVVNHYKSKGSVARDDVDAGDGQGANARLRTAMSERLVAWLRAQTDWAELPQFIVGDLNAYSREDAVRVLEANGFENIGRRFRASASYQFGGRLGSLDHVLANPRGAAAVTGADVWDINADESPAFEYSRRGVHAVDLYAPDPFRSSDHDPIKVGLDFSAPVVRP